MCVETLRGVIPTTAGARLLNFLRGLMLETLSLGFVLVLGVALRVARALKKVKINDWHRMN